jgi:hypothetical protein
VLSMDKGTFRLNISFISVQKSDFSNIKISKLSVFSKNVYICISVRESSEKMLKSNPKIYFKYDIHLLSFFEKALGTKEAPLAIFSQSFPLLAGPLRMFLYLCVGMSSSTIDPLA